ncbi:hypothetical protein EVAR_48987_1 [Eumeta japonica]|uniref:Uncharacterized protein n=1 Tax=Eumeta variegata TaxID=151549 RepID=A0A4C1YXA6_EUMVA|nr:hypothetical protein EVAR_48987_1 [Eumeta japonica]
MSLRVAGKRLIVGCIGRFVMSAEPPDPEPAMLTDLLTMQLRNDLEELFYEPENYTEPLEDDINATTTTPMTTTTKRIVVKTTKAPPQQKWVIPITFMVGPLEEDEDLENITRLWPKNGTENLIHNNGTWYDVTNDTKPGGRSRWAENVTHLLWMNDTEMVIPELGRHKWVRYNIGARGLYRVAPQDPAANESMESAARRTSALMAGAAPAERALLLDDAFVLSRAGRLPASRALAAAGNATDVDPEYLPTCD